MKINKDHIVGRGSNSVTQYTRINDDQVVEHTRFFNDDALKQNARIRESDLMDKHQLGLHDNADTRAAFSFPSIEEYNLFKIKDPETYQLLMSKNEYERIRGAKQLQILHPEYCVYNRY